ncbi:hypothetical protein [Ructibacterium gallinarum]|uniref:Uncharacterized protein n=1 Tax=Ructibacterium gallinarum TaxID=2779355 RepID=A0A9D5LWP3_9FIRM|nr:hypothetical protein [Ructibacterium gallinarum]MBE5039123.1 hypothetical protein [Ructibacterium gallinarum]
MKKPIISFLVALAIMFSVLGLPAYAAEEDAGIVVYQQTFDDILNSQGVGLTDAKIKERDTTFAMLGSRSEYGASAAVVHTVHEGSRIIEDFDSITSLDQNKVLTLTNNVGADGAQCYIKDKTLEIVKTGTGTSKTVVLKAELGGYAGSSPSYAVELDLKTLFDNEGLTVQFTIGADMAFRQVKEQGNKCTFEWWDGSWVKDEENLYDLTDFQHLTFVVNADKTVDAYIGSGAEKRLLKEGMPQRGSTSFTTLSCIMGASLKATTYVDNLTFTPLTEQEEGQDTFQYPVLRLEKMAKGTGSAAESKMTLDPYLCGAKEYTYSFDLQLNASAGYSVNIANGAFIQLAYTDNGYDVKEYIPDGTGGAVANEALGTYPFDKPTNIAFRIHADEGTADLYIDGEMIQAGIKPRYNYRFEDWRFTINNSSVGTAYLDNFTLTLHDVEAVTTSATKDTAQIDFEDFTPGVLQTGTGGFVADNTPALGLISVTNAPEDTEGTSAEHGKALRMYSAIKGDSAHPSTYNLSRNYKHLLTDALEYTTSFDLLLTGDQSYNIAERSTGGGGFKLNFDLAQGILIKYQILDQEGKAEWITAEQKFTPNTWFNVKYVVNTETQTADFYYNDTLIAEDLPCISNSPFGGLVISTNNGTVGELWLDNFSMTVNQKAAPKSSVSGTVEGENLQLSAYVSEDETGAQVFVAYYNTDGRMTGAVVKDCAAGQELKESVSVPADIAEIKLFLWSDLEPLCEATAISVSQ